MSFYDITFDSLSEQLLAGRLRKLRHLAWLRVMITPVKWLFDQFNLFRADTFYWLAHNSQVCFLQAVLNDTFDPTLRRIYIVDTNYAERIPLYLRVENRPTFLYTSYENRPKHLYTRAEIAIADSADVFIVMVPGAIYIDGYRWRALINKYRLPGKAAYRFANI